MYAPPKSTAKQQYLSSLGKFQRAQVKALWTVSNKLLYRLMELLGQAEPRCKCSSLSEPRISPFHLKICTNLLLSFSVVLWLPFFG